MLDTLVWDNHTCMPLRPNDERFLPQFARLHDAGVDVVGVNAGFGEQGPEEHLRMIAHLRDWIARHSDRYLQVLTVDDARRAKREGKLGIFFDIEGCNAIADQLSLVPLYYDLGVRWMSIAYNRNNRVGGGCMDDDPGLSEFGARAIDEMNRAGMIPCVSHTGKRTALDVIAHSKTPVIFSHSNPRALWDHRRNIDDDAILACTTKGGVVGINGIGPFLGGPPDLPKKFARCVDYVAKLAGVDHVAIGLDYVFDQDELLEFLRLNPQTFGEDAQRAAHDPEALACVAPEDFPAILAELRSMGYAEVDLQKIFGGNLMRLAEAIWK